MKKIIKMPKNIETLEQFNTWVNSFKDEKNVLDIRMKKRTIFYPYHFTYLEYGTRVHYLISDSVSTGVAHVKNFNRIFQFTLINY